MRYGTEMGDGERSTKLPSHGDFHKRHQRILEKVTTTTYLFFHSLFLHDKNEKESLYNFPLALFYSGKKKKFMPPVSLNIT